MHVLWSHNQFRSHSAMKTRVRTIPRTAFGNFSVYRYMESTRASQFLNSGEIRNDYMHTTDTRFRAEVNDGLSHEFQKYLQVHIHTGTRFRSFKQTVK
jgi:hypothetical protein